MIEKVRKKLAEMLYTSVEHAEAQRPSSWRIRSNLSFWPKLDTYHWLKGRLLITEESSRLDQQFHNWKNSKHLSGWEAIAEFPPHLRRQGLVIADYWHREIEGRWEPFMTEALPSCLTTQIIFTFFTVDENSYVCLGLGSDFNVQAPHVFAVRCPQIMAYGSATCTAQRPAEDTRSLAELSLPEELRWVTGDGGRTWRSDVEPFYRFPVSDDPRCRAGRVIFVDPAQQKVYCPYTGWELLVEEA